MNIKYNFKQEHHEIFDFLRGLAIFLVFINHIPYNDYLLNSNYSKTVINIFLFGTYGVQLFYIVSAVTLFLSLTKRNEKNFKNFFIRRFFRIAPIFYIGIIIHIIYYSYFSEYVGNLNIINILLNFTFTNNFIPPSEDLIYGGSTITTEMNFYFMLPLLFLLIKTYRKILIFIFLYLLILVFLNYIFNFIFDNKTFGDANFYRTIFVQLLVFSLGICLFFIHKDYFLQKREIKKIYLKDLFLKIAPFIMLCLFIFFYGKLYEEYFYFRNMFLVSIMFFLMINILILFLKIIEDSLLFKFFCKLGRISYSFYILHWITIHVSWEILKNLNYFNNFLIFFILFSFLITYFFSFFFSKLEFFFIKLGKRFTN